MLRFLKCRVSKGMFSDERVIELTLENGTVPAFVVQCSDVKDIDPPGCSAVRVWVHVQEGDRWAMLPTPQRNLVRFRESDLISA